VVVICTDAARVAATGLTLPFWQDALVDNVEQLCWMQRQVTPTNAADNFWGQGLHPPWHRIRLSGKSDFALLDGATR